MGKQLLVPVEGLGGRRAYPTFFKHWEKTLIIFHAQYA
jgi:hypothetical protein